MVASLAAGVIATTDWQKTYKLPVCPSEALDCFGQTHEAVDKHPAILWLGVTTLLLAAAGD